MERTNWRAVWVAYGIGVVGAAQVGRFAPAAEALRSGLGFGLPEIGFAVSLITLASAVFGLSMGVVIERHGAKRILCLSSLALAITVLLGALTERFSLMMVIRILEGCGYLGIVVAAPTLITRVTTPKDAPAALALWGTFFTLGISLAALAGGWVSEALGWRGWFVLNALAVAGVAAIGFVALPRNDHRTNVSGSTWKITLPRAVRYLGLGFFGLTFATLTILTVFPAYLIDVRGFAPGAAGTATGSVAAASILGGLSYGSLQPRLGREPLVFGATALLAITAIPPFSAWMPIGLALACTALAIFASGMLVAHVFASVPRLIQDPSEIGPANGMIAQAGSTGALIGPPMIGYFLPFGAWSILSIMTVVFAVSYLVCLMAAERASRDQRPIGV